MLPLTCQRPPAGEHPPAGGAGPPPALTRLAPGATAWSRDEAVRNLGEKDLAASAVVRLVRLAGVYPLWAPAELSDATFARLRCSALAEGLWAAGLSHRKSANILHAPVLIDAAGQVTPLAESTEEELLVLVVSADAEVFPHVLISPNRVRIVGAAAELVLTLDTPEEAGFQWRPQALDAPPERQGQAGVGYVALLVRGEGGWREAARYAWDPYELMFTGPAAGPLPEPPGGRFELDLENSPLLVPRGGEIPKPKPRPLGPLPPRFRPGQDA
jgi:hypothetical protein